MIRHSSKVLLVGLALALLSIGCQTTTGGLTLPSSNYLTQPQNFPPPLPATPGEGPPQAESKLPPMPPPPEKKSLGKRFVEWVSGAKKTGKTDSGIDERSTPAAREPMVAYPTVVPNVPPADKLTGTFTRETDTGKVTITFEDKLLKICFTMKGEEKSTVIHIEADYSVNKQGQVYGVINSVECPVLEEVESINGEPFAFRTRFDDGVLTISDLKSSKVHSAVCRPFLGKYKRPEAPKPAPIKQAGFTQPDTSAPSKIPPATDLEVLPKPRAATSR